METEDSIRNVYALFPGIDRAPFGSGASPQDPERNDDGWSAVPTRTVATEPTTDPADAPVTGERPVPHRQRRLRLPRDRLPAPVLWIALALFAGAAFGVGHAAFAPTQRPARRVAAAPAHTASASSSSQLLHKAFRASTSSAERSPVRHRAKPKTTAKHRAATLRHAPAATHTVTVRTPAASQPAAPAPQTARDSTTAGSTGAGSTGGTPTRGGSVPSSPRAPSQPAGPTGPVSLIGAGTTPSG